MLRIILILFAVLLCGLDYPIVAVRAPRAGNETILNWQEVVHPINGEPGTHLVLIKPDGTEEVLVSAGAKGCILDPCPSLDGKWVFFSWITDITAPGYNNNYVYQGRAAFSGADVYKVEVATKAVTRLTFQEFTPNTVRHAYSKSPIKSDPAGTAYAGIGVYNTGPCPVPGGRVVFTSSRNYLFAPKGGWSWPAFQLFVMDDDGKNVELVGHLNIGSALHPVLMKNGMVAWSSWESQGYRDPRTWALWASNPDGSNWEPLFSGFAWSFAPHFHAQKSDGEIISTLYYNQNNNGLGTLIGFFMFPPDGLIPTPRFGSPDPAHPSNPTLHMAYAGAAAWPFKFSFSPYGLRAATPSSNHLDVPANRDPAFPTDDAKRLGKYTHPSGAPGNDVLAVYSPGPATDNVRPILPAYWGQLVRLPLGRVAKPSEHEVIKADAAYNYQQPKALVPWTAIYGTLPAEIPYCPNNGSKHALLPEGTPFGLVGTSSFYKRDSANLMERQPNGTFVDSGWLKQGSDSGKYDNSDIYAVRIVQTEQQANLQLWKDGAVIMPQRNWWNPINERLRNLGEIPLRKPGVVDPDGNPDTSFLARIPADTPFTFQTIDKDGLVLNVAQTWHQVRPGEIRNNCGGCHAHSQIGTDFSLTAAAKPDYVIQTLNQAKDVEFERDIWPILQAKCVSCHGTNHPSLVLTPMKTAYENLVPDDTRTKGRVLSMRPRESLLMWKLHGRVLDGSGAALQGARMPMDAEPLSASELRLFAEWVGLGATRGAGAFVDDLRPTLTVTHPRKDEAASRIVIGAFDSYAGLESLTVTLNGTSILPILTESNNVWSGTLPAAVLTGTLIATAKDKQGNVTTVRRDFNGTPPSPPSCEEQLAEIKALVAKQQQEINALKKQTVFLTEENAKLQAKIDAASAALK